MYFTIFISFLILQRLSELLIARRNEKWLLSQGAVQYGQRHYPFMIALHTLFIVSLIAEYNFEGSTSISWFFLAIFLAVLLFKFWALSSLGKYWNTKIYRIPGVYPVKRGPYKFLKHPNYMEVVCEIAFIPLVFHLYYTAIAFTILNAVMLSIRITVENRVWAD
ncbi:isoprenylcysteine carboxyl methyltransferase family protein [Mucilaginibacter sp. L3T2-6]|uniref:isoprenylcysteine carboxyl methyltransferase family protein n=1 Tax=Mucilaginibacter sp. L3T2-6 TaxID=3062491 RepID=UPI0026770A3C|nr:isoprenylcysteine carboxylmethyltransferase family protein [Mucilaginibacter sp. L3T2-6]MDO3644249.1 isoprenylcysteine carboxylmethyltransferase family protein [Mucilaginibacter sp. L3T2-6]MDV6216654.1 isoprenylcysteine carboxylmethyltransferase family protein [Mucilaginibacter sp. L3T2-6]